MAAATTNDEADVKTVTEFPRKVREIENTFIPSDVLTLVHGKHILHFGGEGMFEQDNSTPWGSIVGAQFNFTGQLRCYCRRWPFCT